MRDFLPLNDDDPASNDFHTTLIRSTVPFVSQLSWILGYNGLIISSPWIKGSKQAERRKGTVRNEERKKLSGDRYEMMPNEKFVTVG